MRPGWALPGRGQGERRQSSFHGGQKGWPAPQILLPDRFSSRAAMEEAALGLAACRVPPPSPPPPITAWQGGNDGHSPHGEGPRRLVGEFLRQKRVRKDEKWGG